MEDDEDEKASPCEIFLWVWGALSVFVINATLVCLLVGLNDSVGPSYRASMTILSNCAFLRAMLTAWCKREYTTMMIYAGILICSSMYHSCYVFSSTCHLDPLTYQAFDFFFAQLLLPVTALHIVRFDGRWIWLKHLAIIAFGIVIGISQHTLGNSIYIQLVITLVSLAIIVGYWVGYNVVRKARATKEKPYKCQFVPDIYKWQNFFYGICLAGIACALFSTQMSSHLLYWIIHSCWHIAGAVSQHYVLLVHRKRTDDEDEDTDDGYSVLDEKISSQTREHHAKKTNRVVYRHTAPTSQF